MGKPRVDIAVDASTGRWSVDALPMILVPQHFFLNSHYAVEAALGPERNAAVLHPADHCSAYHWCEREAAHHGMAGVAVFQHYMDRLTQRGWSQFDVLDADVEAGTAHVRVRNSLFVDDARRSSGRKLCYRFAAWFEGSLEYVLAAAGRPMSLEAREVYCAGEGVHDHCLFAVLPRA